MKKVAIYTRVSTGSDAQFTSMKNQKEYYEDFCKKNNYELVKLYADKGISATSSNREQFLNMLYDAGLDYKKLENTNVLSFGPSHERKPKFNYIITKDISRFSRNMDSYVVARELRNLGVYLEFENMGFTTEKENWHLEFGIFLLVSQQESIDRSKKVKFAYKQRAKKGQFHMSRPLYGYEFVEKDGSYRILEEEAEVVKEIFNFYVNEEKGATQIARILNERGLRTRQGTQWIATTIRRMIRNEKYKGTVVLNRLTKPDVTTNNKKIKRDKSEWIAHQGIIDPIVNEETWEKAQALMQGRVSEVNKKKVGKNTAIVNVFHDKIKCGKCGSDYIRISSTSTERGVKRKKVTYMCRNRRMFKNCDAKGISHNKLMKEMDELMRWKLAAYNREHDAENDRITHILVERLENSKIEAKDKQESLRKEIEEIDDKLDLLFNNFMDNPALKSVLEKQLEDLAIKKEKLQSQLQSAQVVEIERLQEKIRLQYDKSRKFMSKRIFTLEEVLEAIDYIKIKPEKKLEIRLHFPSLRLLEVKWFQLNEFLESQHNASLTFESEY
ncbi:recombinase family protein [Sutcliffiella horikoshii]|uniref:recombinase family protein n=1 Tax=Sutcliffiella horikoshii TaxID=79883 RepID=UPI00384EBACC